MLVVEALTDFVCAFLVLPTEIYLSVDGYREFIRETGEPVYLAAVRPQMGYTEIHILPWPGLSDDTAICYGRY